ncbi:MAG: energy-coupling factor ABC transporter ATP-binding protein [Promethearchaeota archaeon]
MSLQIEQESIYALLGNNGAGKSTLLRLMVGLLKPKSGTIKIFGKTLTRNRKQLWKIRQQIGFLFQNPDDQLFAPTIAEDVAFGARNLKLPEEEVQKRTEWALKAVNLLHYKNESPFNLSWGQKKRAALAGLLVLKPKLLILDEPFANLDFQSIHNHIKIIETLRTQEKMTILFTTHHLFFVEKWAQKVFILKDGKKFYEGDAIKGLSNPKIKNLLGSYEQIEELFQSFKKSSPP